MRELRSALPGETSFVPGPFYNLERLAELRDRHAKIIEDYRRASTSFGDATKLLAELRMNDATHSAAAEELVKPGSELQKLSLEYLAVLQISPRTVQQIVAAEARIARLKLEREGLQLCVKESAAFIEKLEIFAKTRDLT